MPLEDKLIHDPSHNYCSVRAALALLGQKWVPHIFFELMDGKCRFNELGVRVGGCNSRTLRDRLRELESMGLVQRTIITTMPPWVEYQLTSSGRELGSALKDVENWGRKHLTAGHEAEPSATFDAGRAASYTPTSTPLKKR